LRRLALGINEDLDHALGGIKATDEATRGSEELLNVVGPSTREFIRREGLDRGLDAVQIGMDVARNDVSPSPGAKLIGSPHLLPDSLRENLTSEQERYLGGTVGLHESELMESEFDRRFAKLGRSAQSELSEEEAEVVLAGVVADSSYGYWTDHLDEWRKAIIDVLPEPDSTIVQNDRAAANSSANTSDGRTKVTCSGSKAKKTKNKS